MVLAGGKCQPGNWLAVVSSQARITYRPQSTEHGDNSSVPRGPQHPVPDKHIIPFLVGTQMPWQRGNSDIPLWLSGCASLGESVKPTKLQFSNGQNERSESNNSSGAILLCSAMIPMHWRSPFAEAPAGHLWTWLICASQGFSRNPGNPASISVNTVSRPQAASGAAGSPVGFRTELGGLVLKERLVLKNCLVERP